ncbi:MAG: shikimate dehydrogenase [Bacteroidota bacterium]|nr:shikimate dehydrogenase [Bacteroidota bacterium]
MMVSQFSAPRILEFFGVTTAGSGAMKLFPQWARALGVQRAEIRGVDLPLSQGLQEHRRAVRRLKEDPAVRGALVTSHKLAIVRAAGDLIDKLTPEARLCGEVSALYKRSGQLWGHACDPANCGLAMRHFLGNDWWPRHPDAQILSLGGGGATVALLVHLLTQADHRPQAVTIVEKRQDNLEHCQRITRTLGTRQMALHYVHSGDSSDCDQLVSKLPPGSMVINATGMGKDIPGSPVSTRAVFPVNGVVWELNYRGTRPFLHHARRQVAERNLIVEDGWNYFLYGWSSVMGLVFDVPITPRRFAAFVAASPAHAV